MARSIVLDTNIWLQNQMLRDSVGSALRFFLKRHGETVIVPEVVKLEVVQHLERKLIELLHHLRADHSELLRAVGKLKELVLPTEEEIRDVARNAFNNSRIEYVEIPFALDSARASLLKCIRKEAPSGPNNQQFKDGVIWADILKIAEDSEVHFVTADKGFYKGRDYGRGLAANLLHEAELANHRISISHTIESVLEVLREVIEIDYFQLHKGFYPQVKKDAESLLEKDGYSIGRLEGGIHSVFATDDPDIAHVEFTLNYEAIHPINCKGELTLGGKCALRTSTNKLNEFKQDKTEFQFVNREDEPKRRCSFAISGSSYIGHRTIEHNMRVPLE